MKIIIIYIVFLIGITTNAQQTEINYSYDNLNRLVQVVFDDGVTKGYIYDDLGNRIQIDVEVLGIDEEVLKNTITVYPNPTNDKITIKLPEDGSFFNPSITLYDLQGRLLKEERQTLENGQMIISLANLPTGVYLVRLSESNSSWSQLIIKN